ncbi:MAG: hypothetical protein LBD73_03775, partial [Deferribacteraceae bacterium]|nr:hypothetical protein [Deferribacteraceae bacterium]
MSVFVRCRKCPSFHSYRKERKCGYRGKEKSCCIQHKADGEFKPAFASNSLAEAREPDARYKYEMNVQKRLHLSFSA